MVSHELNNPNQWQELLIEQFETGVDTEAFEAVVEHHKVRDNTLVRVDNLSIPHAVLPPNMTEMYAFPGRMEVEDFRAHLSRSFPVRDEEGEIAVTNIAKDESWIMNLWFTANDQPYALTSTALETTLHTTGLRGQNLDCSFSPDTMARFLTSMISTQMKLSPDSIIDLRTREYSPDVNVLQRLLLIMGGASADSVSNRERLVWLPQAEHMRALSIKFDEMESNRRSGRKLSYRLAWKPEEMFASDIAAYQTEYSDPTGVPAFFSTRSPLDYEPHQLLETQAMEELTDEVKVGAYFDADLNRREHASVLATIKPVLDMYLARYAHLDVAALDAIIRPEAEE
jgi:hypothetical protein